MPKKGTFNNEGDAKKPAKKLKPRADRRVPYIETRVNAKRCVGCGGLRTTSYPICNDCAKRNKT